MKDLRYFLNYVGKHAAEEIFRVRKEVDPSLEITYIARKLVEEGRFPIIYCEKVKGHNMPVVCNLLASRKLHALSLETDESKIEQEIVARMKNLIKPKLVDTGPAKDVILKGNELDVGQLPILTVFEKDGGPYITGGITVVKDPDTGISNSGIYRIMYKGEKNRLGIFFLGDSEDMKHIYKKMEDVNKPLEAAIYIGHHPLTWVGSFGWGSLDDDEMDAIGALMKEPLEIVACETVDVEVPAHAEIVIEGIIPPHVREPEGPFGEYNRYYGFQRQSPVFEITAITHRKDAIYFNHQVSLGIAPLFSLSKYRLLKRIKEMVPQVLDFRRINAGMGVIKIKNEFDGLSKQAGLAALGANFRPLMIIVVDDDIDINSTEEVLWAIATRTKPDRDFCFIYDVYGNVLEACGYSVSSRGEKNGLNTRVLIDATKPVGIPFPEKVELRREAWENIDLASLLRR